MHYEPRDNPYEHLNDPCTMDRTPVGTLRVFAWGKTPCVAIVDDEDTTRVKRIIHQLQPNEHPLSAIYGKRKFELKAIAALYDRRNDDRARMVATDETDLSKDLQRELTRFANKHGDEGEEVLHSIRVT